jgi:peptide/nickel transport system permease protein
MRTTEAPNIPSAPTGPAPVRETGVSYWRQLWRRFRRSRRGIFGILIVVLLMLVAFLSPLIAGNQPIVCRYQGQLYFPGIVEILDKVPVLSRWIEQSRPFGMAGFDAREALADSFAVWPPVPYGPLETTMDSSDPPSGDHWLGTDDLGRDLMSRMVHGAVVSVKVGIVSMGIAALIGILVGGLAGFYGGWVDAALSRLIEVVMCFPVFFLILSLMVWLEPNIINVMVVIGLTRWTSIARYSRGEFIRLKTLDYVVAARAAGAGSIRIMWRHLLPNSLAPVLVAVSFGMAQAILIEAGLSWLGFGVQWPDPSWGNILRSAFDQIRVSPYMVYPPCVAIFLAVLAYNLIGDALRDAVDPRLQQET